MQVMTSFGKLRPIWAGYLFIFDKKSRDSYPPDAGIRILMTCLLLEGLVRPALRAALHSLGVARSAWSGFALVAIMLMLAIGLTRFWIRVSFECIGLNRWRQWASTEKWFFPQIAMVTLLVFTVVQRDELGLLSRHPGWIRATILVFAWQMIWGFYQEYMYRGLLQTELVRRWGAAKGILVSNLLFTFGPLHAYHFWIAANHPSHLAIFAGIFAIGLYFAVLFHRSGNLWMIGVLHGLGDFFIDGLQTIR
jgi:uncharacterized protein